MNYYAFLKRCSLILAIVCGSFAIWETFNRNYMSAMYYVMLTAVNHFAYNCYKNKKERNDQENQ